MSKLHIYSSATGFDVKVECEGDVDINDEVMKRMRSHLGNGKITGVTSPYTTQEGYEMYVTNVKMGNGVTFMSVWTRVYTDEPELA